MDRREFMLVLAGAMTATRGLRAQQKAMPVIGFLSSTFSDRYAPYDAAFRQGLRESGFVEEQNVAIEYRWAEAAMIGCRHWPPTSSPQGRRDLGKRRRGGAQAQSATSTGSRSSSSSAATRSS